MKKLLVILVLAISSTLVFSQRSIDELFEKYAGKDGFTTVTINGNLLKLVHCLGDNDSETSFPEHLTEIRILAQDHDNMNVENFYNLVIKDIDLKSYDEFVRVKKTDKDLRILVRIDGKTFKEFLLISGGTTDNAIVQIKGNMSFDEVKKLSDEAEIHGLNINTNQKKVAIYK